ncbi:MAG: hypothetical protein JWO20_4 [Candidatus Angelobacter sp.]|nr:hypothetical protein [Candidatus Angelobacter sp.]
MRKPPGMQDFALLNNTDQLLWIGGDKCTNNLVLSQRIKVGKGCFNRYLGVQVDREIFYCRLRLARPTSDLHLIVNGLE